MTYYYGMRLRGFSPMCQPKGAVCVTKEWKDSKDVAFYSDIICFERKLSVYETDQYSLDYLGTENV